MKNPFKRNKSPEQIKFIHAAFDNGIKVTADRASYFGRWNVKATVNDIEFLDMHYVDRETLDTLLSIMECAPANYEMHCLFA